MVRGQASHRMVPAPRSKMGISFAHELRGLDEALAACLHAATQEAINLGKEILTRNLTAQFLSEGLFSGAPWLPRHAWERTLPRRPLLFSTGRLRASFLDENSPDHVQVYEEDHYGRPTLLFGSRVPYAPHHQWGTTHLPPRAILTETVLRGAPGGAPLRP